MLRARGSESYDYAAPPGRPVFSTSKGGAGKEAMDVVVERCAGLDVHRDNVVATVRYPSEGRRRWLHKTRTFKATLAGLGELAEWLADFAVTLIGTCTGSRSSKRWRIASSPGS